MSFKTAYLYEIESPKTLASYGENIQNGVISQTQEQHAKGEKLNQSSKRQSMMVNESQEQISSQM